MPKVVQLTIDEKQCRELAGLADILGDATRVRVLAHLSDGVAVSAGTLVEATDQAQPAVSHHLKLLRLSGLVEYRRQGKQNFYTLTTKGRTAVAGLAGMVGA